VEAIISIAIFALIMVTAGRFIVFSLASWNQTQADAFAISRTSNVMYNLEKEVRQAHKPSPLINSIQIFSSAFGTEEPENSGSRVEIHTDFYGNSQTITYLVYEDALWKIYDLPPEQPDDLADLSPVISRITKSLDEEGNSLQFFEVDPDRNQLTIRFNVMNPKDHTQTQFEVNNSFTARNQGGFK